MKAWMATNDETGYSVVVFAETCGKARYNAMLTEEFEGYSFTEIRLRRCPKMDRLYNGRTRADWFDAETRKVLVSEYGWRCLEPDLRDCESCPALEDCETGQELTIESEE